MIIITLSTKVPISMCGLSMWIWTVPGSYWVPLPFSQWWFVTVKILGTISSFAIFYEFLCLHNYSFRKPINSYSIYQTLTSNLNLTPRKSILLPPKTKAVRSRPLICPYMLLFCPWSTLRMNMWANEIKLYCPLSSSVIVPYSLSSIIPLPT